MSGTTQNVLSRMSFNGFCPTATGYVAMGQIKIYVGARAGLGTGLRRRTLRRTKNLWNIKI